MDEDGGSEIGVVGSINLCNGGSSMALDDLTDQVHQLPCCIKYDGPCTVSHYFKPKPTEMEMDGLKVQESYFRGRKLQGATIPLPHGYSGFVLGKKSNDKSNSFDKSEENSNCWEMKAKFQNVTFWNNDTLPSQDDAFFRTFHWLTVANALHNPVTAEDLECAAITK